MVSNFTADIAPREIWESLIPSSQASRLATYMLGTLLFLFAFHQVTKIKNNAPLINRPSLFQTKFKKKMEFVFGARDLLHKAQKQFAGKCYRVIADYDDVTVIPAEFAHDIRNDKRFEFREFFRRSFLPHLHGLAVFADPKIVHLVAQNDLTKDLAKVMEPLHEETILALSHILTESEEWHDLPLHQTIVSLVARISSRVFLGDEICRNEEWFSIMQQYTMVAFMAVNTMRLCPSFLQPLVARVHPGCRKAAALIARAREIMQPVLTQREQERAFGRELAHNDAIDWFAAKGEPYDPVLAQMFISFAAIHTTADLMTQAVSDLAQHPDMVESLRKEMRENLTGNGLSKASIYNLKLLDSCVKESQRIRPASLVAMHRVTNTDVTLPDGTVLPKGSSTVLSASKLWDPKIHDHPDVWDGARFYRKRQVAGHENESQLVSTSPGHLAFGHGEHACPGRFFAATELKVTLVHLLCKYDVLFEEKPKINYFGFVMAPDPGTKLMVKKRKLEELANYPFLAA